MSKADTKRIAEKIIKNGLAPHKRVRNTVMVVHGMDAFTICTCETAITAEIICIALNRLREEDCTACQLSAINDPRCVGMKHTCKERA